MRTSNKEQLQTKLSVQESFHLWDLTRRRYLIIEQININTNFIHDKDFMVVLKALNEEIQDEVKILEKLMNEFAIKGSTPNTRDLNIIGSKEIVNDEQFAHLIHQLIQSKVQKQLKAMQDTKVNDKLRDAFTRLAKNAVKHHNMHLSYLKTKG